MELNFLNDIGINEVFEEILIMLIIFEKLKIKNIKFKMKMILILKIMDSIN
jgi:hypothetical protein